MSHEERIEAIANDMETWDSKTLLGWAQAEMRMRLRDETVEDVDSEYHELFDDMEGVG